MATIIDSFVIELGLDPRKFTQGQKDAVSNFKRLQEESETRGKNIEASFNKVGETISALGRRVLALGALFIAGRGITALAEHVTKADVAIGRLSGRVGVSVGNLGLWENAVMAAGGHAGDAAAAFETINDEIQKLNSGLGSELIAQYRTISAAGGHVVDATMPINEQLIALAANAKKIAETDPRWANWIIRQTGASEALTAFLLKGPDAIQRSLDLQRKLGVAMEDNVDSADSLWAAFQNVENITLAIYRDSGFTNFLSNVLGTLTRNLVNIRHLYKGEPMEAFELERGHAFGFRGVPGVGPNYAKTKTGAGTGNNFTDTLGQFLQANVPGFNQITSLNDDYHRGQGLHGAGRALDFTLTDPSQSAAVAAKLRALLGSDATVLDEYLNPLSRATAGHIHVGFPSEGAANRFASQHTTNVGPVTIYANGKDAEGIRAALMAAGRQRLAAQANSGPQ